MVETVGWDTRQPGESVTAAKIQSPAKYGGGAASHTARAEKTPVAGYALSVSGIA